jgi:hypothetical protein
MGSDKYIDDSGLKKLIHSTESSCVLKTFITAAAAEAPGQVIHEYLRNNKGGNKKKKNKKKRMGFYYNQTLNLWFSSSFFHFLLLLHHHHPASDQH